MAVKSQFFFAAKNDGLDRTRVKRFRDPLGLEILCQVAGCLRADGFQVTDPKEGKACDAIFCVQFADMEVSVVLGANRPGDRIECFVLTWVPKRWRLRPFWRLPFPQRTSENWNGVCDAIERALKGNANVLSLTRLTLQEGSVRWNRSRQRHGGLIR